MNLDIRKPSFSPSRAVLLLLLLAGLSAAPILAQPSCANGTGWDVRYNNFAGTSTSNATCFNDGFKCEKAKSTGPVIELANPACDPKAGPCTIRLRVPLEFPGNLQNIAIAGGPFGAPTPQVFWFTGGTPPASCAPRFDVNCGQISICGITGAQYIGDFGETSLSVGSVSCSNLTNPQLTTFSISVFSCESRFSCPKRLDLSGIDLTPPAVAKALGCPVPRKWPCPTCEDQKGSGHGHGSPAGKGGVGNPADSGPGALLRYAAGGAGGPGFPGTAAWNPTLGRYWSHDYAQRVVLDPGVNNDTHVWLLAPDATFREFTNLSGGVYQTASPSDEHRKLYRTASGWELHELDGRVHFFDGSGLWTQTVDRNGNAKVATYSAGRLASVAFPDGRSESFTYDVSGKLATITEVGVGGAANRSWSYTWTGNDLTRIARPDGTAWEFFYADPANPGWMTRMDLVGTDGSRRVDTAWQYDSKGNTIRLWRGDPSFTGPSAVDKWSFSYDNPTLPVTTTVTDPLGKTAVFTFGRDTVSDRPRVTVLSGDCPSCGLGPNVQLFYEDAAHPLLPTRTIDGRGTTTVVTYNANGLMTSKTEGFGTPLARTTTWEYNGPFPALVTRMERPSTSGTGQQATVSSYDGAGNQTSRTVSGIEGGSAFSYSTTTTYNSAGRPLSIDPPGYGVQDATSFTYDGSRGNLLPLSRTDPLIGSTSFSYDAFNRTTSTTDPNGVSTDTTYDALNRVTSITQRGATSAEDLVNTRTYNVFGDLFRTTLPLGNVIEYSYDATGRLVSIERKPDASTPGERTIYTLDGVGHHTREELQRWNGTAWVTDSATDYVYSTRCRLDRIIHADSTVTEHAYDCEGNLQKVWDANHPSNNQTSPETELYTHDVLNRVTSVTQPWGGSGGGIAVTRYAYDVQDHLTQVTDANGTVTNYTYSDRGLLTRETSEVSGATVYSYNEHGAQVSRTDARNIMVTRTVDALNRVVFVDFPENNLDIIYTYDDPAVPFSKARLTAMTRNGQSINYSYDRFGRMLQDGGLTYSYDKNGNRKSIGYPGNVKALLTFDFADRPATLSMQDGPSPAQILVSGSAYKASGLLTSLTLGNGLTETHGFNQRDFPSAISVPGRLDWTYTTDALGNVMRITDNLNSSGSRTFSYQDTQYFLTQANGPWGTRSWTYDRIGNRLSETRDSVTQTYSYSPNAAGGSLPKLAHITGGTSVAVDLFYDAVGNLSFRSEGLNKLRLTYDSAQQLSQQRIESDVVVKGLSRFTYDSRRFLTGSTFFSFVGNTIPDREALATYDFQGMLRLRTDLQHRSPSSPRNQPEVRSDVYIFYLANRPVAIYEKRLSTPANGIPSLTTTLTYLTTDHLGTPILATSTAGATWWQGGFEPFGADWNSAESAGLFLRFPGQWDDAAWKPTNLFYNLNRWYESQTGRYTQADPLGNIEGDKNLFTYAMSNPIRETDPLGLDTVGCDLPPFLKLLASGTCYLECCAQHDKCYDNYNCGSSSWTSGPGDPCGRGECSLCNNQVVSCFMRCAALGIEFLDDPNKDNYYCAALHRFVRIPGDFRNVQEAEPVCELDHCHGNSCETGPLLPSDW